MAQYCYLSRPVMENPKNYYFGLLESKHKDETENALMLRLDPCPSERDSYLTHLKLD